jgi:putative nucleotidyltransferase with HDIG domain
MMAATKILFNKSFILFPLVGVSAFIIISFFHDGLNTSRNIQSYFVPILVGFLVGTIMGLMKVRLDKKKMQVQQFFLNIIETLANSLDEKDKYTHGHVRRVTNLSMLLGREIGLKEKDLELLRIGGILHDIGKIGVPDNILLKSGKLSNEEFELIKRHPGQGAHILKPMNRDPKISKLIQLIKHHHERYDGKGYPDGLDGESIPLPARIIAVADSFDAMTSDRPYRKGMARDVAVRPNSRTSYSVCKE